MALVTARALVLQSFPYGETSKILRVLTPDYGLRSLIAKGAARPRSRFGAVLEPFTEGDAQFYLREGRDLHTLGGFDLVRSRQALGRNLAAFAGASLLCELVLRFATEEAGPALYGAVVAALDGIADAPAGQTAAVALAAVWRLVAMLGYEPQLHACVVCGVPADADGPSRFDLAGGGIACFRCRPAGRVVEPAARRALADMLTGHPPSATDTDWSFHRALLRGFLMTHFGGEHPLRSLELFLDEMGHSESAPGLA